MRLVDYLNTQGITAAEFARRLSARGSTTSRSAVLRWTKGERRPRWGTLHDIAAETGGAVQSTDFMPPSQHRCPSGNRRQAGKTKAA